ncbi:MAG: hypothetical protein WC763_06245 [Candidatus Paceibacterota bacterium]
MWILLGIKSLIGYPLGAYFTWWALWAETTDKTPFALSWMGAISYLQVPEFNTGDVSPEAYYDQALLLLAAQGDSTINGLPP